MDLKTRPPRSARVRLGGYVILPRMLDKGRAELAGTSNDYHYACPLDQAFLSFAGVNADALKAVLAEGKGDGEALEWIQANASVTRTPWEIEQWSDYQERLTPSDVDKRAWLNERLKECAPNRKDLATIFDYLDADDFVSYGGKA